jgi:small subunit ribosomal protein S9
LVEEKTEEKITYYYGTGKRKSAIARVRLYPDGEGKFTANGKSIEKVFPILRLRNLITRPLKITRTLDRFSVWVKVEGGGVSGQAGAIAHGISRALVKVDEKFKPLLRKNGFITRDSRVKERQKYGLKRARKAKQYRKR